MRIKDWDRFQHFKDRKPIWIKLYRELLNDKEWHELDATSSKILIMLWLLASEADGELPVMEKIAFRLRLPEKAIESSVSKLSHWVVQDDIKMISSVHHDVIIEKRREETEKSIARHVEQAATFWTTYKPNPRKVGKGLVEKWFAKHRPTEEVFAQIISRIQSLNTSTKWAEDGGKWIPSPMTWLNQERWKDEAPLPSDLPQMHRSRPTGVVL